MKWMIAKPFIWVSTCIAMLIDNGVVIYVCDDDVPGSNSDSTIYFFSPYLTTFRRQMQMLAPNSGICDGVVVPSIRLG